MELSQLEEAYDGFYVPAFVTKVAGQDLVRDLFMTVSSVSVDLKERAAGRFSLSVASTFDWESREFLAKRDSERIDLLELFAFGSQVEIKLGYGEPSRLPSLFTGIVTELSTSFGSSAPVLTVSGYDDLYALTVGRNTHHWEDARDSDAVSAVLSRQGIPGRVEQTEPVKRRIDQNQETDMAFIDKLAKRNGATFYVRDGRAYFGPRQNDQGEVVRLAWGEGLVSFSPQANLARQITEVEVRGWNSAAGEAVVGRARRGDETGRDTSRESGADRVGEALSDSPVLRVRAAVHTQAEADARAQALLEERAQEFVTGDGECVGLPEIVPDVNVALDGLGRGFSKTYYVSEATHSLDQSGYRTSFKVKESTV